MDVINGGESRNGIDSSNEPREIIAALLQSAGFVRLRLSEFLERYELTEGRYAVLTVLDNAGAQGLSQSEVAEQLMQSESNISTLIDRLHRDGFVDRRWSDTDRRKRVLLLTVLGEQLVQRVEVSRRRWAESLFAGVSLQERRSLALGLKQLHRIFHEVPGSGSGTTPEVGAVGQPHWPTHGTIPGRDPNSPQSALERMLSTLGLTGRIAEDVQ